MDAERRTARRASKLAVMSKDVHPPAAHGAASRPGAGEREQWSGDGVGRRPQAMASCMKTERLSWQVRKALERWLRSGAGSAAGAQ